MLGKEMNWVLESAMGCKFEKGIKKLIIKGSWQTMPLKAK